MRPEEALQGIDVVVLAGELGSRLRGVPGDTPKVLAPVAGRAFLGHLLDHFAGFGARRVVLCLGHRADRVTAWLAQGGARRGLEVTCSVEPKPLGTAGALRFVRGELGSDPVLVANGETFLDADLRAFVASHRLSGAQASVLCAEVPDTARYGRVEIGPDGRIRRFDGRRPGHGVVGAGIYLFSAAFLDRMAASDAASLERDVLEAAAPGSLHAHVSRARLLDIGAPEDHGVEHAADPAGDRDDDDANDDRDGP